MSTSAHQELAASRSRFIKEVEASLQQRPSREPVPFFVVYVDIVDIDKINQGVGKHIGDMALQWVFDRLHDLFQTTPSICAVVWQRIANDDFALFCLPAGDNLSIKEHHALATALCSMAEAEIARAPMPLGTGVNLPVSIIAGAAAAIASSGAFEPDLIITALSHAKKAMRRAYHAGKGQSPLYDPNQEARDKHRDALVHTVLAAIRNQQVVVHYQPKINTISRTMVGVEALVRLWDPTSVRLRQPLDFLPCIERTDIISELGKVVLRSVLRDLQHWRKEGLVIQASVNIAAQQMEDPAFVTDILSILQEFPDIPPEQLIFEIVETSAVSGLPSVANKLRALEAQGLTFHLDDFGTGYSSLIYLKHMPVTTLKIDGSFVRGMLQNGKDAAIVQACIGIAESFGLAVVAEGVETVEIAKALANMGCPVIQGYLAAEPMTFSGVRPWLDRFMAPQGRVAEHENSFS